MYCSVTRKSHRHNKRRVKYLRCIIFVEFFVEADDFSMHFKMMHCFPNGFFKIHESLFKIQKGLFEIHKSLCVIRRTTVILRTSWFNSCREAHCFYLLFLSVLFYLQASGCLTSRSLEELLLAGTLPYIPR